MKVIQIWGNDLYPPELIGCANSVIKAVGRDNYTLICNNLQLPHILGVTSINFDEEFYRILGELGDYDWWTEYCTMNMYKSDMMRLYYASQIPDLFYLDIDTVMLRIPEFKSVGKSYIYNGDIRLFYVNDQIEWFTDLLESITSKLAPGPFVIYNYVKKLHLDGQSMFRMDNMNFLITDFGKKYKI